MRNRVEDDALVQPVENGYSEPTHCQYYRENLSIVRDFDGPFLRLAIPVEMRQAILYHGTSSVPPPHKVTLGGYDYSWEGQ